MVQPGPVKKGSLPGFEWPVHAAKYLARWLFSHTTSNSPCVSAAECVLV